MTQLPTSLTPSPATDRRFTPTVIAAATIAGLITAAAAVGAVATGNTEFIFYLVIMVVAMTIVLWLHLRLAMSAGLIWCLVAWAALHMAGGLTPLPEGWPYDGEHRVLYSWWIIPKAGADGGGWLKYDQPVHAFGFGVMTWLCWQALTRIARMRHGVTLRPTFGVLVICAAAGCGFGALNEIIEFIATRIAETNVGGYENTGWDLVYNAVGAVVAAVLIRTAARPDTTETR